MMTNHIKFKPYCKDNRDSKTVGLILVCCSQPMLIMQYAVFELDVWKYRSGRKKVWNAFVVSFCFSRLMRILVFFVLIACKGWCSQNESSWLRNALPVSLLSLFCIYHAFADDFHVSFHIACQVMLRKEQSDTGGHFCPLPTVYNIALDLLRLQTNSLDFIIQNFIITIVLCLENVVKMMQCIN